MIEFDHEVCGNPESALRHEWLETNGLGGFASSTITGLNARRYHGLLVAALQPPTKRTVLLSKLEEELVIAGQGSDKPARRIALSTNQYPGVIHPAGYQNQVRFRLDPFPVFTYRIPLDDGTQRVLTIEKSVFMPNGKNAVVIQYHVEGDSELRRGLTLYIRPLVAFRDYHSLQHVNSNLSREVGVKPGLVTIQPYSQLSGLHFGHDARAVDLEGYWYYRFQYLLDQERGQDYEEDLYSPFGLSFDLASRDSATVIASTETDEVTRVPQLRQFELQRRRELERSASYDDPLARALTAAADQFVVARGDEKTVIAGYP